MDMIISKVVNTDQAKSHHLQHGLYQGKQNKQTNKNVFGELNSKQCRNDTQTHTHTQNEWYICFQ